MSEFTPSTHNAYTAPTDRTDEQIARIGGVILYRASQLKNEGIVNPPLSIEPQEKIKIDKKKLTITEVLKDEKTGNEVTARETSVDTESDFPSFTMAGPTMTIKQSKGLNLEPNKQRVVQISPSFSGSGLEGHVLDSGKASRLGRGAVEPEREFRSEAAKILNTARAAVSHEIQRQKPKKGAASN